MIVTRFAPSPTGYLHVGGARTALFNWLLARRTGGKFILRIEDTDVKRNTPAATAQLIADLRWLGIDWDEGPEVGGPNGPYLQSQRLVIYNKYIAQLLEEGKAYYCFDTPEELTALREKAMAEKKNLVYSRPGKFPDEDDVTKAKAKGLPVTVRLVVDETEPIMVRDEVRGEITFGAGEIGDFIIQKSDGYPTYHMAVVVDDELMGVTHVIRGQEHLMNTPGHQMLQKALGFRVPTYAHMSVTVSDTGGKLSKRERPKTLKKAIKQIPEPDVEKIAAAGGVSAAEIEKFLKDKKAVLDMPAVDAIAKQLGVYLPEINVVDFLKSGYLPEAMLNFLALLGWNPGGDREVMTTEELISLFDVSRLTKTNSLFDRQKLLSFNTEHIRITPKGKLLEHLKVYLKTVDSPVLAADDKKLGRLIEANAGAKTLANIDEKSRFLFIGDEEIIYDEKSVKKVLLKNDGEGLQMLAILRERLAAMEEVTAESLESMLRALADEKEVGLGKVAQPLRVAICGGTVSPTIFDSVDMLTIERTLARIDIALKKFKSAE